MDQTVFDIDIDHSSNKKIYAFLDFFRFFPHNLIFLGQSRYYGVFICNLKNVQLQTTQICGFKLFGRLLNKRSGYAHISHVRDMYLLHTSWGDLTNMCRMSSILFMWNNVSS